MFSTAPIITESGLSLLLRAAGGEAITFTKFQAGKGILGSGETMKTMTALKDAVLEDIPITQAEDTEDSGYIRLSGSFNNQTDIEEAFRWTELGLIAEDEDGVEYLYAYGYDNENSETIMPGDSDVIIEQNINVIIAIGESENITANVIPDATYASQANFLAHTGNTSNPHGVTYTQAGAAAASHTHAAAEIISGILPAARGGTGVSSLSALKAALGNDFVCGMYVGDKTIWKDITIGWKPAMVMIFIANTGNNFTDPTGQMYYIREGENLYSRNNSIAARTGSAETLLNEGYGGAAITNTGFAVGYSNDGVQRINDQRPYMYIAVK